jgi:diacylglycerol kinase (ATP)
MTESQAKKSHDRVIIIANPKAGSADADFVFAVAEEVRGHAEQVDVLWTARQGQAAGLARRSALGYGHAAADLIVVIGGDGTIREVASGLTDIDCAALPSLLFLPGGTGNSNYRSLWDDVHWREALVCGLTGAGAERRDLDLARIADPARLVVLGASTGLFAEATARATTIPISGRARYMTAIATVASGFDPYPGQVLVDGAIVHEGPTVLVNVGGSRHRAGVLRVLPFSLREDGLLDVCVIGPPLAAANAVDAMLAGSLLENDGVVYARGKFITVRRLDGRALRFESDGEVVDSHSPDFTIEVLAHALPVMSSSRRPGG